MLDEALRRLIVRELEEIDTLLRRSSPLLESPGDAEPSFERLAALSTILNSFYTGAERIFQRIVKEFDPGKPEGERWHIELLNQVAGGTESRPAVISEKSRQRLRDYLAFRHRSRNMYANNLVWDAMAQLSLTCRKRGIPSARRSCSSWNVSGRRQTPSDAALLRVIHPVAVDGFHRNRILPSLLHERGMMRE